MASSARWYSLGLSVLMGLAGLLYLGYTRPGPLDGIDDIALVERPGQKPSVLAAKREGDGIRALEFDLTEGEIVTSHTFAGRLRAVGGSSLLYEGPDGNHLVELSSGLSIDQKGLYARWPQIAPWKRSVVTAPGVLTVDAADGRAFQISLADGRVEPAPAPTSGEDHLRCTSDRWAREGGAFLAFLDDGSGRRPLTLARPDGQGGVTDLEPLPVDLPSPSLLCDELTGKTATFRDGAALVAIGSEDDPSRLTLAKMRADGRIAWRYPTREPRGGIPIEVYGAGHSLVVHAGSTLLRIRADGTAEWRYPR